MTAVNGDGVALCRFGRRWEGPLEFTREIDAGDPDNPIITGRIVLVPEPSTALLLTFGLMALALKGRHRPLNR